LLITCWPVHILEIAYSDHRPPRLSLRIPPNPPLIKGGIELSALVKGEIELSALVEGRTKLSAPEPARRKEGKRGGRVFRIPINPGDRFSLGYTHSVQYSRVTDDFEIDQHHRILLVSTTFSDHGAGLPYGLHREGVFSIQEDGRFKMSGIHKFLPEILLRVGREYSNIFVFGARRIDLSKTYGDALLTIRTRKCTVFRFLLWRVLNVK
jgi:hypothetical protein